MPPHEMGAGMSPQLKLPHTLSLRRQGMRQMSSVCVARVVVVVPRGSRWAYPEFTAS